MLFGISTFATDYSIGTAELAREAEARGFDSIWLAEHTHIPLSQRTLPDGAALPQHYWHSLDPFLALAAAAAATKTIKLAFGVCLVIERDTITTAKEVSTLDLLSGGRVIFGIGGGWNEPEMRHHGTDPKTRFARMREQVRAMKEIWTKDEAEFHGQHVDFDPIWQWPKPVQKPHPPVVIGGGGPRVLERVVDYGDGWYPLRNVDELERRLPELNRMAEAAGKPKPEVSTGARPDPAEIERLQRIGVERVVFGITAGPRDEMLARLDEAAGTAKRFA